MTTLLVIRMCDDKNEIYIIGQGKPHDATMDNVKPHQLQEWFYDDNYVL